MPQPVRGQDGHIWWLIGPKIQINFIEDVELLLPYQVSSNSVQWLHRRNRNLLSQLEARAAIFVFLLNWQKKPTNLRYVQFTMFFRHRRHCDVDDIVSISCQRIHLRHRDVDDIVSHRYPVNGGLSYLVYIVHIVDIAILTISCRYRVNIGTLSSFAWQTSFTSSTLRCWRYRVDIVYTSVTCHTSLTSFTSSTSRCWRYRVDIVYTSVPCHISITSLTLSTSRCWRYNGLSFLVNIVDIAILTISCRYRVNIGTLSSFAWQTSFTSSTLRCWRYRVDIV